VYLDQSWGGFLTAPFASYRTPTIPRQSIQAAPLPNPFEANTGASSTDARFSGLPAINQVT
jgi:hypothetical protein